MHARHLVAEHLGQEIAFTTRSGQRVRGLIELLVHVPAGVRIKLNTERASLYLRPDDVVAGASAVDQEVARAGQLSGAHLGQVLVFSNGAQRIHGVLEYMEVSGRELNSKNILLVYKTRGREGYRRLAFSRPLSVMAPRPEDLLTGPQWRARYTAAHTMMTV